MCNQNETVLVHYKEGVLALVFKNIFTRKKFYSVLNFMYILTKVDTYPQTNITNQLRILEKSTFNCFSISIISLC